MSNVTRFSGFIKKGWGHEYIFATNELYCGKILHFDKAGNKFSMHFHKEKDEAWYVTQGSFTLRLLDTKNASVKETSLHKGDSIRIYPLIVHQLIALEDDSEIIEVSTPDSDEDNYRVFPGDNQVVRDTTSSD
jgi:mannose-6-phosphate isomerase-like protein (cupin superfamily)